MNRKYFQITFIVFISQINLPAQDRFKDSIQIILANNPTDSIRVKTLNGYGRYLFKSNIYDTAIIIFQRTIALIDSTQHGPELIWPKNKAYALHQMGLVLYAQGKYNEAIAIHLKELPIQIGLQNKRGEANTYSSLGVNYWSKGEYPESYKNYYQAIKLFEESKDSFGIANIYNNIGGIHEYLEEWDDALKYYSKSLAIFIDLKNKQGMATVYNNIGNIYDYKNNFNEAHKNHYQAFHINEDLGNKQGMADAQDNIANTYSNQRNYPEEINHRLASLKIKIEIGDNLGICTSQSNIGASYLAQNKFNLALLHFKEGLKIATGMGARDRIMDAYHGVAESLAGLKEFQEAYFYQNKYTLIRDSLRNEENDQQIAKMNQKYESDKKDGQIQLLQKDQALIIEFQKRKALIRNLIIGAIGVLLLIGFIQYRVKQLMQIVKMRNNLSKDLHDDIGSTLSSISINCSAVERMKPENFQEVLSTVAIIGRNTRTAMENMSDIVWAINPVNDTFQNMMDRLQIFSTQLLEARDIQVQFNIPQELRSIRLSMPQRKNIYLILREAIHNVAKYSKASNCIVSAKLINKKIEMEVKDNGMGFSHIIPGLGGNGMVNMQARADDLKAQFKIHSELQKGTRVSLQIAYS